MKDNINPDHYKDGGLEVIDILKQKLTPEQFEGFCIGNVIKYTLRARLKNGVEDLKKAAWYSRFISGDDPRRKYEWVQPPNTVFDYTPPSQEVLDGIIRRKPNFTGEDQ